MFTLKVKASFWSDPVHFYGACLTVETTCFCLPMFQTAPAVEQTDRQTRTHTHTQRERERERERETWSCLDVLFGVRQYGDGYVWWKLWYSSAHDDVNVQRSVIVDSSSNMGHVEHLAWIKNITTTSQSRPCWNLSIHLLRLGLA